VANAREEHRDAERVGRLDDLRVAVRAARLHDCRRAGRCAFLEAVGERKNASLASAAPSSAIFSRFAARRRFGWPRRARSAHRRRRASAPQPANTTRSI
jgi:hypothetical protein